MINVMLAEDHSLVRNAIKALLDNESDIKVTGEAEDSNGVLEFVSTQADTDVIIAELLLYEADIIGLIRKLKEASPRTKIIFLSVMDDERHITQAISAGAMGYLNKTINVGELLFAVRHVHNKDRYICSRSSMALVNRLNDLPDIVPLQLDQFTQFSVREIEILTLMAEGLTNFEIAEKLFTSKRTVENYRQCLLNKTGSRNTAALIKFAIKHSVIKI